MGEHTSTQPVAGDKGRSTLGELIHVAVRGAIEAAVEAELGPRSARAVTSAATAGRATATGRRRGR